MTRVVLRQPFFLFWSMAAIAAAATLGCGGGSTSKTQTATASVSPSAGGTVALADSSAKLEVPPGAVSSTTMITMTATSDTAPAGITADSPILKFEPDGLVFATPVTVTFTFKSATSPVVYWSNGAGGYDIIGGTVTGDSIAAQVSHFSRGFVGEAPSSTDKCNGGLSCAAGATCAYGASGGSNAADGGTRTGSGGDSIDASASAGGSRAPTTSALSSSDPGSSAGGVAMCCVCGGGAYQCGPCSSAGGADGGAPACAEGAACTAGSRCGNGGSGNGGSGNGATNGGGVDASTSTGGSRTPTTSALSSSDPSGTGSCCTCGSDGTYHCSACTGTNGGADASTTGPGASCAQGAQCQPGSGLCANGSPDSCEQCVCGADGTYACAACAGFDGGATSHDGGGVTTGGGLCVPGAACTPEAGPCEDASLDSCLMCSCGGDGKLACAPCGGGTTPDAGAGGPPACSQGQACAGTGMCKATTSDGACVGICTCANGAYECGPCASGADGGAGGQPDASAAPTCAPGLTCAAGDMCKVQTAQGTCAAVCSCANGTYQCGSCAGSADAGAPPPSDGGAAQFSCQLNGPCPQPGAMCTLGSPGNGFQCTCGDSKTLACVHWDAAAP